MTTLDLDVSLFVRGGALEIRGRIRSIGYTTVSASYHHCTGFNRGVLTLQFLVCCLSLFFSPLLGRVAWGAPSGSGLGSPVGAPSPARAGRPGWPWPPAPPAGGSPVGDSPVGGVLSPSLPLGRWGRDSYSAIITMSPWWIHVGSSVPFVC